MTTGKVIRSGKRFGYLNLLLGLLVIIASASGIFSDSAGPKYIFTSIHGQDVVIFGRGLYQYMSADVAIQGIAQDYITLFFAVPLLVISSIMRGKSMKWNVMYTGVLGYIFISYIFYLLMAMYNVLFLVYVIIVGLTFFMLLKAWFRLETGGLTGSFDLNREFRVPGIFLIINSLCISLLWLNVIVTPLVDGRIYPELLAHYTTLVVQGLDLALLLPLSFLSGYWLIKKNHRGFLLAPPYLVFLVLMMSSLMAKVIFLGLEGYNIFPVVYIIPMLLLISFYCAVTLIMGIETNSLLNRPVK